MKFHVRNLGCKVNRVESDAFAAALISQGAAASSEEDADLVIVNTCTVTGEAEKKARKAVRHALGANPDAEVLVTGCAAAIDPQAFEAMGERVRVVGKGELLNEIESAEVNSADSDEALPVGEGFRTRVGVKVQDGCDRACSYCIVHVARGPEWSRPADEVLCECRRLARAGVKEIVLSGINLGSYRDGARGEPGATTLVPLLERLLAETEDLHAPGEPPARFRISSIEPRDVGGDLIGLLAASEGRICRHLHLPLQSGSDKVLREMARPYDSAAYLALVDELRGSVPQISLSTDLIVGFPGETEEDFRDTLELARRCAFSRLHVFPYSRREGTPAAARTDQVPPELKARRAGELRALGDELRSADYDRRVGERELVLVEDTGLATTESYHEVAAPQGAAPGALLPLVLPPRGA